MAETAYILLGGNLGNRPETFRQARQGLVQQAGPIGAASSLYETAAWGRTNQPDFLNQVVALETTLSEEALLTVLLGIEKAAGRQRRERWGARVLDLDLLYFSQHIIALPQLQVPHPYIPQRRFTLVPLVEIAPDFVHPVLQKTQAQLLAECPDTAAVRLFEEL